MASSLRRVAFVAALAVACLAATCLAGDLSHQYKKFKEVPGIAKGEDGQFFIHVEEQKYYVAKDLSTKQLYFINEATNVPQWHDPRGPAPTPGADNIDIKIPLEVPTTAPKGNSITVALVAMLPVLLLLGGTVARVAYLQINYPEMLWPTKERRDRRKAAGGKQKAQKARGKMNQDGKGGRSSN